MKLPGKVAIGFAGLLLAAQLVRPARTNPPEESAPALGGDAGVEAVAAAVLERACADCHTNRTVWPWYSQVAPVSWLVIHDVDEGRSELNLSEWGRYPQERQEKLLGEICEDVEKGEMPPATYLLMHPGARLAPDDARALCAWARREPAAARR